MDAAYSIRVVASRTGIPADTLRVWERRYGFPKPARRPGGGRLYRDEDVIRLQLIARARDAGYRPGDVIALPNHDIERLVEGQPASELASTRTSSLVPSVASLVEGLHRDEVGRVRGALRALALALGPRAFVTDVAHPLAVGIGEAWASGKIDIRHEHLGTALLSAQLRLLLTTFEDSEEAPVVLLATLPGEAHALGLEMVAVYLATHRATARYLGADTPPEQIARAARSMRADVVGISVSGAHPATSTRRDVARLRNALAEVPARPELWVGGAGANSVAKGNDLVRVTTSWTDIDRSIATIRERRH